MSIAYGLRLRRFLARLEVGAAHASRGLATVRERGGGLPHDRYAVGGESAVTGKDCTAFELCLSDQEPVEGVAVMKGKLAGRVGVTRGDREHLGIDFIDARKQITGSFQLSDGTLDGDLPDAYDTYYQSCLRIFYRVMRLPGKAPVGEEQREQRVCIE